MSGQQKAASPRVQAFIDRIRGEIVPKLEDATLPILRVNRSDKLIMDRTGVFICIGDEHFVWTAAHELEKRIEQAVPLSFLLRKRRVSACPSGGVRFSRNRTRNSRYCRNPTHQD